jgi:hypothetical protein
MTFSIVSENCHALWLFLQEGRGTALRSVKVLTYERVLKVLQLIFHVTVKHLCLIHVEVMGDLTSTSQSYYRILRNLTKCVPVLLRLPVVLQRSSSKKLNPCNISSCVRTATVPKMR